MGGAGDGKHSKKNTATLSQGKNKQRAYSTLDWIFALETFFVDLNQPELCHCPDHRVAHTHSED